VSHDAYKIMIGKFQKEKDKLKNQRIDVKEILKQYENMNWIKLTEYMSNDRLL
jgi:hypothetical protein